MQSLKPGGYTFRVMLETVGHDLAPTAVAQAPFAVNAGEAAK